MELTKEQVIEGIKKTQVLEDRVTALEEENKKLRLNVQGLKSVIKKKPAEEKEGGWSFNQIFGVED